MKNVFKSPRFLIAAGIGGMVLSSVAASYATYQSYDQINEGLDKGYPISQIAKQVGKNYIPAAGLVIIAGGFVVASEILGEHKIAMLEARAKRYLERFNTVRDWYVTQDKAIQNNAPKDVQEAIERDIFMSDIDKCFDALQEGKMFTMYDPITDMEFTSTKAQMKFACMNVNKYMTCEGVAHYEELYSVLGLKVPKEYEKLGWSLSTADAMWVFPWLDVEFEKGSAGRLIIKYVSDRGDGKTMSFEPVEDPESEGWL